VLEKAFTDFNEELTYVFFFNMYIPNVNIQDLKRFF